jgi:hypothetical protein
MKDINYNLIDVSAVRIADITGMNGFSSYIKIPNVEEFSSGMLRHVALVITDVSEELRPSSSG